MADDEFGRRMIYPTNTHPNRAKPWFMGKGNWLKRKFNGVGDWNNCPFSTDENDHTVINFDTKFITSDGYGGTVTTYGKKGRLPVLALPWAEYGDDDSFPIVVTSTDQSYLRKRGFMGTKNDWKNVEVTLYWKTFKVYDRDPGNNGMGFCVRGGPHHSDTPIVGNPCAGIGLYVEVNHVGQAHIQKELRHPKYSERVYIPGFDDVSTYKPCFDDVSKDLMDKWIGMKGIFYTKANGNPYIELWFDRNADNNWERLHFHEDTKWFLEEDADLDGILWREDGNGIPYSHHGNFCGGETDEPVTWGGPGVIFKIMGLTRVDLKWGSIREIMPPEGWPLRYLLDARKDHTTFSMRALAQEHRLVEPISLRQLTELEAELYPFD